MLDYLKYGAVIGVTALGGAYLGMDDKAETEAILAQFQFSEKELERFNVCKTAMIKAGVAYDDSTDAGGCACTVDEIKNRFPESRRDVAHAYGALDSELAADGYTINEEAYLEKITRVAASFDLPKNEIKMTVQQVDAIIKTCSMGQSSSVPVS